jgi:RNA recognition motif-containing protein
VQIYKDDAGQSKGEAILTYEEANSAHAAVGFFNNTQLKDQTIKVQMAKIQEYGGGGGDDGGAWWGRS